MRNVDSGSNMQEQVLIQVYYWIPVPTFNLFLWQWLLFSKEHANPGLHPGPVGHKHPHRDLWVMERQYMVNIHGKSPVRRVLFPPTKHWRKTSSIFKRHTAFQDISGNGHLKFDKYKYNQKLPIRYLPYKYQYSSKFTIILYNIFNIKKLSI